MQRGGSAPAVSGCAAQLAMAQHLDLIVDVETIAALDLERGHSLCGQGGEPRPCCFYQLAFTRGAHRSHGGNDASASRRDFRVRGASEFQAMFARPQSPA